MRRKTYGKESAMQSVKEPINLLVTFDRNYVPYFNVMLSSLLYSNPEEYFNIYILHTTLEDRDLKESRKLLGERGEIFPVTVREDSLESAPTTDRYPKEIYYRYLPRNIFRKISTASSTLIRILWSIKALPSFTACRWGLHFLPLHRISEICFTS